MPPLLQIGLPTNAPTSGPAAMIAWSLIGLAFVLLAFSRFAPSGKDRLAYRSQTDTTITLVFQEQIKGMKEDIRSLKLEVRRLTKIEESNREYRHVLANRSQLATSHCEVQHDLLNDFASAPGAPDHLVKRARELKTINEILQTVPLPEVKHWTIVEIEREIDGEEEEHEKRK